MDGVGLVTASIGVGLEHSLDFVAHPAEHRQLFLLAALGVGRVVESPMMAAELAGKDRAGLVGVAADRDHRLHVLLQKLVHVLAVVAGNVDPDLRHDLDRQRMDVAGGIRPGAAHVEPVAGGLAQEPFRQVAAARVAGAQDQDDGEVG